MDNRSPGAELPQFRIHSLNDQAPAIGDNHSVQQEGTPDSKSHAFKMRKASYDKLVMEQPQAVLSYDDVDDGEKITVGSGIELEQRLHEPAIVAKHPQPPYITKQDMHSFDINKSDDAHRVWQQRSQQELQRNASSAPPTADFGQEADRLKRELQDRIGRLSAQMKSTAIDGGSEDPDASDKISVTATAGGVSPRMDCFPRMELPNYEYVPLSETARQKRPMALVPQSPAWALPYAGQQYSLHANSQLQPLFPHAYVPSQRDFSQLRAGPPALAHGSLTPQGTKMAQRAAAAIAPKPLKLDSALAPDANMHASRWASYGNTHPSFKLPVAELSTGAQAPRAELNSSSGDGQPLMEMFQAELAKITKGDPAAPVSTANNEQQAEEAAPGQSNRSTTPASSTSTVSQDTASSLKSLFAGIGELAAQTLESNPSLVERFAGTGVAAVQSAKPTSTAESQLPRGSSKSGCVVKDQKAIIDGRGELVWIPESQEKDHSFYCILHCPTKAQDCPVREIVKNLAQDMDVQEKAAHSTAEDKTDAESASSSKSSKAHQSTQTGVKEPPGDDKAGFEADRVLAKRYISYNSMWGPTKIQYLVRWVAHGSEHDVWYDAENLGGCKGLIELYEKGLNKKRSGASPLGKDEIHAIHLRTAGDRMVASRKWEETEEVDNHRRFHEDDTYRDRQIKDLRKGLQDTQAQSAQALASKKVKIAEPEASKPASVEAKSSSLDAKAAASPSAAAQSTLRHRKSWHPSSTPAPEHRAVSPTSAAQEKYPAISSFEAAHHGAKVEKRKSVPNFSHGMYSLNYPHVEGSRQAWLGSSGGSSQQPEPAKSEPASKEKKPDAAVSAFNTITSGLKFPRVEGSRQTCLGSTAASSAPKEVSEKPADNKDDTRKIPLPAEKFFDSLDYPQAEECRKAWLDFSARGTSQKDKSVRFDLKDPWIEKKQAQEAWGWKQSEEESLYGAPETSTSAKKEGKKPARYSSPPPPKSAIDSPSLTQLPPDLQHPSWAPFAKIDTSSLGIWNDLTKDASLRRAKSLNFPEHKPSLNPMRPFASSNLRFSSSAESKDDSNSQRSPEAKVGSSNNVIDAGSSSKFNDFFGPIRPKRELSGLRRTASARFPDSLNARASASKRDATPSIAQPGLSRSQSTSSRPKTDGSVPMVYKQYPPMSFDDLLGANPWSQDRRSAKKPDPWAFLHDHANGLKYPAMTPSKPANSNNAPSKPAAPNAISLPQSFGVNRQLPDSGYPSANAVGKPSPSRRDPMRAHREVPPAVLARNDAIAATVQNLIKMGYEEAQAKFVSESADGNMDEALDMLQEDLQARYEFEGGREEKARKMPGAF